MNIIPPIKWYRKCQYGIEREFIHPDCAADAAIIKQLTGHATINGIIRELLRDLSRSNISFIETIAPLTK